MPKVYEPPSKPQLDRQKNAQNYLEKPITIATRLVETPKTMANDLSRHYQATFFYYPAWGSESLRELASDDVF